MTWPQWRRKKATKYWHRKRARRARLYADPKGIVNSVFVHAANSMIHSHHYRWCQSAPALSPTTR